MQNEGEREEKNKIKKKESLKISISHDLTTSHGF